MKVTVKNIKLEQVGRPSDMDSTRGYHWGNLWWKLKTKEEVVHFLITHHDFKQGLPIAEAKRRAAFGTKQSTLDSFVYDPLRVLRLDVVSVPQAHVRTYNRYIKMIRIEEEFLIDFEVAVWGWDTSYAISRTVQCDQLFSAVDHIPIDNKNLIPLRNIMLQNYQSRDLLEVQNRMLYELVAAMSPYTVL